MRLCRRSLHRLLVLTSSVLIATHGRLRAQTLQESLSSVPFDTHLPTPANLSLRSLFLIGDSEISSGPGGTSSAGEGWGKSLAAFLDPTKINIVNRAITSSSSRAYVAEGFWADTLTLVKAGDVVLIQFGENETAPSAVQSPGDLPVESSLPGIADTFREISTPGINQHSVIHTYGWYLRQLVVDTIARGATPILCSPTPHRDWQAGHIRQSAETYAGWAQAIAIQQRVPFLNLNRILADRYDSLGETAAAPLFNSPGTNTNQAGAEASARIIIGAIKGLRPDPLLGYFSEAASPISAIAPPPPPPPAQPAPGLQPTP